jgi:hypothetical protein
LFLLAFIAHALERSEKRIFLSSVFEKQRAGALSGCGYIDVAYFLNALERRETHFPDQP